MQHWTWLIGRMQQKMLEFGLKGLGATPGTLATDKLAMPAMPALPTPDPAAFARSQESFWAESIALWQRFLDPAAAAAAAPDRPADRRFAAPEWQGHPLFAMIRQSYELIAEHMLKGVDTLDGLDPQQREQIRFATRAFVDAMSPSNFAGTNPQVIARTLETGGENLLKGLEHMLGDLERGQLSHVAEGAFELGRNIATTPGQVVHETPLYQLIQYDPTTPKVRTVPLIIFPPWINRFYILDLNPAKSFIRWAVEQGLTVFVVSWKSADADMAGVVLDDYVKAQIDAIDTVREGLGVEAVHAIGYCVAGTTLATTLALLEARGQADKVASATFFTAQVDFAQAGDLKLFVDDAQLDMIRQLSAENGYTDGRYMALTFNLLRGRDLIWNYVVNNYLLGEDYPAFDLLHWNGDTTNLPAAWHLAYLTDLYRDNKLIKPGAVTVDGTPIDISRVRTPAYVQAGREDHIAPAESVWKITEHFAGPLRFVLAGSGHIAGVVNPPSAGKYQYWTNDRKVRSFDAFLRGASETKGSWWPDWLAWLLPLSGEEVPAKRARIPGKGRLKAIEPAPGRYVRMR
ncbi:PHA/PHB synthase family protein [Sphingomonas quercus]|nr:class I poly(R)-hydroxyalkanoic acid synthase [Sphingomonas quercus]